MVLINRAPVEASTVRSTALRKEFYWYLRGDLTRIITLVTSPASPAIAYKPTTALPRLEDLDGKEWPVFWTKEVGRIRVFATAVGHEEFIFIDPDFRIILLRTMAGAMNESFGRFKQLVTMHLGR